MTKPTDKDENFMKNGGQTPFEGKRVLQEIVNDDVKSKKHDFRNQNEIHARIRNDEDYDDWEYGTEPIYEPNK